MSLDVESPLQVVSVAIPCDGHWSYQSAAGFIRALLPIQHQEIALRIHAKRSLISWELVTTAGQVKALCRAFFGFYPKASVKIEPAYSLPPGERWLFPLTTRAPFYVPLVAASPKDWGTLDPIKGLVASMGELGDHEEMIYQVKLSPGLRKKPRELQAKAQALLDPKPSILGRLFASKGHEKPSIPPADRDLAELISQRALKPLTNVSLLLVIRAHSKERAMQLRDLALHGLSSFYLTYPTVNGLRPARQRQPVQLSPEEIAALWHPPGADCATTGVIWNTGLVVPLPPALLTAPKQGALLGLHSYQGVERPIYLSDKDRETHVAVLGKNGMGKSTGFEHQIKSVIEAGHGAVILDPHGKLVQTVAETCIPPEREKDLLVIDLADRDNPPSLNLLRVPDGVDPYFGVTSVMEIMERLFEGQFSPRMEDTLYHGVATLASLPGSTIGHAQDLFHNEEFRANALGHVEDDQVLKWWFDTYSALGETERTDRIEPVLYRLRAFTRNPQIRALTSQPRAIDWGEILEQGKIVLVNIPLLKIGPNAKALGALILSQLMMAGMARKLSATNIPCYVYCDEAHNFATTALATMLSEIRKYKVSLTLASQFFNQFHPTVLQAILGNVGTNLVFRVGPEDASIISPLLGPTVSSDMLTRLDRFQMLVLMQSDAKTLDPFPVSIPRPLTTKEPDEFERSPGLIRDAKQRMIDLGWARPTEPKMASDQVEEPALPASVPVLTYLPHDFVDDTPPPESLLTK